ncbi:MAG: hypothetical protein Tsb0010_11690 [Parvularculaceae bacterium]
MKNDARLEKERKRLRDAIRAYGADMARWPAELCEAAPGILENAPDLAAELEEARLLDAFLDEAAEITPSTALREAVLAAVPNSPRRRVPSEFGRPLQDFIRAGRAWFSLMVSPAGALGWSAAAGLALGLLLGKTAMIAQAPMLDEEMASYIAEYLYFGPALDGEEDDA